MTTPKQEILATDHQGNPTLVREGSTVHVGVGKPLTNNQTSLSPEAIERAIKESQNIVEASKQFHEHDHVAYCNYDSVNAAKTILYFKSQLEALKSSPSVKEIMEMVLKYGMSVAEWCRLPYRSPEGDAMLQKRNEHHAKIESSLIAREAQIEALVKERDALRDKLSGTKKSRMPISQWRHKKSGSIAEVRLASQGPYAHAGYFSMRTLGTRSWRTCSPGYLRDNYEKIEDQSL